MRDENEIQKMADKAATASYNPTCFGQTYEEGVRAALDWVLDESIPDDESPV